MGGWGVGDDSAHGELVVDGVTVNFGGVVALERVSLTLDPGQIVGVIGPNGAGKTTLFNVICGFVRPVAGRLSYSGVALHRHRPHDLARLGIARTLQGLGLWGGLNVVENVMAGAQAAVRAGVVSALLGLPRSSREEAKLRTEASAILDRLGIAATAELAPASLPYGVQKLVSLARALMAKPSLLLLDEPASGLSNAEMDDLGALLGDLRGQMSVLLVEHHMDLVMSTSDRLVVLNFGRVIASGAPDEVRGNPEVTTAYLGEEVTSRVDG